MKIFLPHCATLWSLAHLKYCKMVPGFVIPSAEESCIIKCLLKAKANPKEILCRSNVQYDETILSHANIYDGTINFLKTIRKF